MLKEMLTAGILAGSEQQLSLAKLKGSTAQVLLLKHACCSIHPTLQEHSCSNPATETYVVSVASTPKRPVFDHLTP